MSGRRPKSAEEKAALGNLGKRAPGHNPKTRLALPDPPESVKSDKLALQLWNFVAAELLAQGVITPLYGAILGIFCVRFTRAEVLSRLAGPIFRRLLHALELAEQNPADLGANLVKAGILIPGKGGLEMSTLLETALRLEKASLDHAKDARACMVEMGMTPASHSRLRFPGPEDAAKSQAEDKFRELAGEA